MFIRTIVRLAIFLLLFSSFCVYLCNANAEDVADSPEVDLPEEFNDHASSIENISVEKKQSSSTTTTTSQPVSTAAVTRRTTQTNRNTKSKNRRRKTHPQNLSNKNALVEFVPDMNELKPEQTCLIGDVCMRNGKLGYCYKPHEPVHYERDAIESEDFYEMMQESCAHFFDSNDNLKHPLCCSPEQEETIARLNANIDLIRKSCPSCLYNVKRLFCNIFCAPNQRDFLRVERVKGETVMEVTMAISPEFVTTFFSSCRDVRVFGAYLLDYDYGCGKHRRANCTAGEFIRVLGGLSEIPFNFKPLIVDSSKIQERKAADSWPTAPMNDTAYNCYEAPPNQASCHCEHCPKSCSTSQRPPRLFLNGESPKYSTNSYNSNQQKTFSRRSSSSTNQLLSSFWNIFTILFLLAILPF